MNTTTKVPAMASEHVEAIWDAMGEIAMAYEFNGTDNQMTNKELSEVALRSLYSVLGYKSYEDARAAYASWWEENPPENPAF